MAPYQHKNSEGIMVSIWWVVAAFVIGGYAGAVLVALMSMAGAPRERVHVRPQAKQVSRLRAEGLRAEVPAHRRHATAVGMHS